MAPNLAPSRDNMMLEYAVHRYLLSKPKCTYFSPFMKSPSVRDSVVSKTHGHGWKVNFSQEAKMQSSEKQGRARRSLSGYQGNKARSTEAAIRLVPSLIALACIHPHAGATVGEGSLHVLKEACRGSILCTPSHNCCWRQISSLL